MSNWDDVQPCTITLDGSDLSGFELSAMKGFVLELRELSVKNMAQKIGETEILHGIGEGAVRAWLEEQEAEREYKRLNNGG